MRVPGVHHLASRRVPRQAAVPRAARPATAPGAARRVGYDSSTADTLRRTMPMLVSEPVAWLSTVRPDGRPHIVPTWFWWDGEALLVFSKPDAVKVRNLRADPRLMIALGDPVDDFAVALIEAVAALEPGAASVPDAFFRKYAAQLAGAGLDRDLFRTTYTQAIRLAPTRFLPWRGRGTAHESGPWAERGRRPAAAAGAMAWATSARSSAGRAAARSSLTDWLRPARAMSLIRG